MGKEQGESHRREPQGERKIQPRRGKGRGHHSINVRISTKVTL